MKYFTPLGRGVINSKQQIEDDTVLHRQLQISFVKHNQERFNEITEAIKEGDIKLAHRLAHTLKGNAGQLGETSLQNAAAEVERLLKDGDNLTTGEKMRILEAEFNKVIKGLMPLLDEIKTETKVFDRDKALLIIDQLEPMLQKRNPECQNFVNDLRAIPGAEELADMVEDFDFKAAVMTISELKKKWS